MADRAPQSFAHHGRYVPFYHFGVFSVLVVNLLWSLYLLAAAFSWPTVLGALMALALLGLFSYMRIFALTVQDRVIRLEMRLRLEKLLPQDLKPRIESLTPSQLIGLRFASDEELPALVREVLDQNIRDRKDIKRRIKSWRPDHLRV